MALKEILLKHLNVESCPNCGEKYGFENNSFLDEVLVEMPCSNCGFLLFFYEHAKARAENILLTADPEAKKLSKSNPVKFAQYLEEKTGIKNFD